MQIVFSIMFVVICLVAILFWVLYEKECEKTEKLSDKICEMKGLKHKTQLTIIGDYVEEYRKDRLGTNAYEILAKISDVILDYKKELATTTTDNKFKG